MSSDLKRRGRYPFQRSYARNSAIIVGLSVLTLFLLVYPNMNASLWEGTMVMTVVFAFAVFCARFLPFRRTLRLLRSTERVTLGKPIIADRNIVKLLMVAGIMFVILLPIVSIRFLNPAIWLATLLGYALGLNAGELAYYLFVRRIEASMGRVIYAFDSEDPVTRKRIMGYRLEKIGD